MLHDVSPGEFGAVAACGGGGTACSPGPWAATGQVCIFVVIFFFLTVVLQFRYKPCSSIIVLSTFPVLQFLFQEVKKKDLHILIHDKLNVSLPCYMAAK